MKTKLNCVGEGGVGECKNRLRAGGGVKIDCLCMWGEVKLNCVDKVKIDCVSGEEAKLNCVWRGTESNCVWGGGMRQ